MSGIDSVLLIFYTAAVVIYGGLIFVLNGLRPRLLWLLLISLPLSCLVNWLIKRPLVIGLVNWSGQSLNITIHSPWWWLLVLLLISPIFEEAIKLLPMALPFVRRLVTSPHAAIWVGLALGVSFGLGEAAYIAFSLAMSPQYSDLPAAAFAGFGVERWITCLLHGVMTAICVLGIQQRGRRILSGYLAAVFLHIVFDSTPLFVQTGALSVSAALWIEVFDFVFAIALLVWLWQWVKTWQTGVTPPKDPQSAS